MKNKSRRQPLTPEEIRQKAKSIVKDNPIYMHDEPSVVGSPKNLTENLKEDDDESKNGKIN